MTEKRLLRGLLFGLLICLVLGAARARADIYIKQKMHTDAFQMMGQSQPAKDVLMTGWITENMARNDTEGGITMLLRGDKKMVYTIDQNKKQYSEMPMDFDKMLPQAAKETMTGFSAKVTETNETKIIKGWHCRKYFLELNMGPNGSTTAELWATEDLKVEYAKVLAAMNPMLTGLPGYGTLVQEIKKIKGIAVYQTAKMKMMGLEVGTSTEVLECGEKPAPAGTYDIPAGYTKVQGITG